MTAVAHDPISTYARVPGDLTLAIMGVLWRAHAPMEMGHIHRHVCREYKPVALTTVSSTLTRLINRGWVSRPRRTVYQATITRRDLAADVSDKLAALIDQVVLAIEKV